MKKLMNLLLITLVTGLVVACEKEDHTIVVPEGYNPSLPIVCNMDPVTGPIVDVCNESKGTANREECGKQVESVFFSASKVGIGACRFIVCKEGDFEWPEVFIGTKTFPGLETNPKASFSKSYKVAIDNLRSALNAGLCF